MVRGEKMEKGKNLRMGSINCERGEGKRAKRDRVSN